MHAFSFLFSTDTATTEIYTLSLHDALPICGAADPLSGVGGERISASPQECHSQAQIERLHHVPSSFLKHGSHSDPFLDRKSTRLNSSHVSISYAVFCLKKKKK